jgi:hypothetical protein
MISEKELSGELSANLIKMETGRSRRRKSPPSIMPLSILMSKLDEKQKRKSSLISLTLLKFTHPCFIQANTTTK